MHEAGDDCQTEAGANELEIEHELTFTIAADIYSFLAMLKFRGYWGQLGPGDKMIVYILTLFSATVQVGSFTVLFYMWTDWWTYFGTPSDDGTLVCEEHGIDEVCSFTPNNVLIMHEPGSLNGWDVFARLVAFLMATCFSLSNMSSILHYWMMLIRSCTERQGSSALMWAFFWALQVFGTCCVIIFVCNGVIVARSLGEALETSVAFIILLEVDDAVYVFARDVLTFRAIDHASMFRVHLKRDAYWWIKHGVFSICEVPTYVMIYVPALVASAW
eukprot:CAMPEP_0202697204 /NCGR_PEP_ID=MMETSP1385-20130828/10528_1 /ASSEMBLY_ACC=CAM_ASM_000861 /TAXON_ID=933848 /ORGANISM="Elphidium margaritaceum" /LENGTH=273 /DNA_ID=CAMNT_0049353591 /DNA_START=154 /DNA_END=972 /DNA_ORIENTATION=-